MASDARRRAEEALAKTALLGPIAPASSTWVSVRSDDLAALLAEPAPAPDAVREAAERLRGSLHATLDPMNLLQYVWPIQRAAFDLLAALDARPGGERGGRDE